MSIKCFERRDDEGERNASHDLFEACMWSAMEKKKRNE
jgi:hypothetical protein